MAAPENRKGTADKVPDEFQPLLKRVMERAQDVLLAGAEIKPCAYMGWAGKEAFVLFPFSTETPEDMEIAAARLREAVAETRPEAVVVLMEAWDGTKMLKAGLKSPPTGMANMLLLSLETAAGYWKADIPLRLLPGRREFDVPELSAPTHIQGCFVNIFGPQ